MAESLGLSRKELMGKSLRQVLDAKVCELRMAKHQRGVEFRSNAGCSKTKETDATLKTILCRCFFEMPKKG
jgi:hypothetical protein